MSARAPQAIWDLWNKIHAEIPRAKLSGIVGDVNHSFGYHLARRDLPSNDYSVVLGKDQLGKSDCASALDVSLPPDLMKVVTSRLLKAAKSGDSRLHAVREFCGTTNGSTTHNYDLHSGHEGLGEWDDSHLWHVHLSFYREYADDAGALVHVADVMAGSGVAGKPAPKPVVQPSHPSGAPKWPLPAGHYFGLVSGPNESHGGFNMWERPYIKQIQQRLQRLGYAPKAVGWADGVYEQPTLVAVEKWQKAKFPHDTRRFGVVYPKDWARLLG